MLFRRNVVVPAILVTFFVTWSYSGSIIVGLQSMFKASLTAAGELFDIFLIIAVMTALLHALKTVEADQKMIIPFQRIMKNAHISFWVLVLVTYTISLFFWPTPAVPLVGAILIPVAIRSGLPAVGAGMAIAISGQGMALSSDYIIQIAPTLSASAAQLDVAAISDRALTLSLIAGGTALFIAYLSLRKKMENPSDSHLQQWEKENRKVNRAESNESQQITMTKNQLKGKCFAFFVPLTFLFIVVYMAYAKFSPHMETIQGGDGAALIGGAALMLLITTTLTKDIKASLEQVSTHIIEGLLFAFKAMGIVLPIAGFFFLGSGETATKIIGQSSEAPAFLFELLEAGQHIIPENVWFSAFGILLLGMVTGLDGSGFSGLPLTGALSEPLGAAVGMDPVTLAALGQLGAIWVGGGTLIAWSSLVAVAGFAKVPVMTLVRSNFIPVILGLITATIVAILFF